MKLRTSRTSLPTRRSVCLSVALSLIVYYGIVFPQHYTADSMLDATIDDPVFGGLWELERHSVVDFQTEEIQQLTTQRKRHGLFLDMLNATVAMFNQLDLQVFLEGGALLGYFRNGEPIPWDIDVDVGVFGPECREKFPHPPDLLARMRLILPPPYHVEYFDYSCDGSIRCDRFAGIITDTRNGFKIDIFAYNNFRSDPSIKWHSWESEWIQRDDEWKSHRICPKSALFPLQYGEFSSGRVQGNIIPNNLRKFLHCDYGFVLEPFIYPYGLLLNCDISIISSILLLIGVATGLNDWCYVAVSIGCTFLLGGGFRLISLILSNFSRKFEIINLILITSLIIDFGPLLNQSVETIGEALSIPGYMVHDGRFCLFHKLCWNW
jgi:hypothetical protein